MPRIILKTPKIILKFKDSVLKEVDIDQPQFTIGRQPDNDLVIENPAVSGHHARIIRKQGGLYIEDLGSTNGTFVNDKKIGRHQLKDTDEVTIGKHVLLFQEEVTSGAPPQDAPKRFDPEETVAVETKRPTERLHGEDNVGVLQVMSGKTDRKEYTLTDKMTIIGSQETATIKVAGWFTSKAAAMITRGDDGYFVTAHEGHKHISLNGSPIQGRTRLKNGDLVKVAGAEMRFYRKDA